MPRLLLLDCDGTLRSPRSGAKFIQHPEDQEIIPGADKAIAHYVAKGWICVGITNQGGVADGHKQLADAIAESEYTLELLPQLLCIYLCPDFEGQHCWLVHKGSADAKPIHHDWAAKFAGSFRKPKAGMLLAAIKNHGGSAESWYIGDRPEDKAAAAAAGTNFLSADIWRDRFLPGIHEIGGISREQIEFLEGI